MHDSTRKKTYKPYKAVVFDMDGTLIEPLLDFQKIRREIGLLESESILESIKKMPPDQAQSATEILISHEMSAARTARLMPNAQKTLIRLKEAGLKLALLTRNTQQAMWTVLDKYGLEFDISWSREDGPIKPQPDSILKVCEIFNVTPDQTACVGDFYFDMAAANSAGSTSILLAANELPNYAVEADIVIKNLNELTKIIISE